MVHQLTEEESCSIQGLKTVNGVETGVLERNDVGLMDYNLVKRRRLRFYSSDYNDFSFMVGSSAEFECVFSKPNGNVLSTVRGTYVPAIQPTLLRHSCDKGSD